jgi:hypothetical protein
MKAGDKVILTESGYGFKAGKVGYVRIVGGWFVPNEVDSSWVQFEDGAVDIENRHLAPVVEQPELEALLEEREYKRFWAKFQLYPLGLGAIISYVLGIYFILDTGYPFGVNYLVGFVLAVTSIGLGFLINKKTKENEDKIREDER